MSQEYTSGWATHLPNALWVYRKSPKFATRFSPFFVVWDKGSKPSKSDDSIFEAYADTGEGKRGRSLYGKKV